MYAYRSLNVLMSLFVMLSLALPTTADAASRRHVKARNAASVKNAVMRSAALRQAKPRSARNASNLRKAVFRTARNEPTFDREGNPLLRSSAFIVQDLETGRILLEKNASLVQPIASITKLMTAMVVLDAGLDLQEMLEITDDDVDRLKGTSSHLPVGTHLTRENLLRLALMASENRAASALGRSYPGGLPAFLEAMNQKAHSLGLHETRFYDSIGLNKNNVASARDLVQMTTAASRYPVIRDFTTTPEYTVSVKGRDRSFHNTNALVRDPDSGWQINLSKTGYISESGKCLVMQAVLANRPTAIVLLDSNGAYTRVADAIRVRKWVESAASPRIASAMTVSQVN